MFMSRGGLLAVILFVLLAVFAPFPSLSLAQEGTAVPTDTDGTVVFVDVTEPQEQPAPIDDSDPLGALAVALIALSATVSGFVEYAKTIFLKPLKDKHNWSDEHYVAIVSSVAIASGIVVALIAGPSVNLFSVIGVSTLPSVFGVIAAGILIALGNQFIHEAYDFWRGISTITAGLGAKQFGKIETTTVSGPGGEKTRINETEAPIQSEVKSGPSFPGAPVPKPAVGNTPSSETGLDPNDPSTWGTKATGTLTASAKIVE